MLTDYYQRTDILFCLTVYLIPLNPLDSFSLPSSFFRQREDSCSKAAIYTYYVYGLSYVHCRASFAWNFHFQTT